MDSNKKRGGAFFLRLALQNIWHNRHTYVPYLLCAALIFGVYLLISGLVYSDTLTNLPSGNTAAMVFTLGMFVFFLFSVCFMQYINRYLISQRKREFGLYGILGLEKRHIGRVLLWENLITLTGGLVIGTLFALLFGRLLFWALLKVIRSVAGSTFSLAPDAFLYTAILYAVTLVITSLSNLRQVRHSSSMELMQSPRRGEKDSRLVWPMAILGVLALGAAYYYAWTIENPGTAIGVFFLLVLLVIFGTFVLSSSGSVVLLRTLQKNKHFYYSPEHYVTVSGLRQRMKQNAKSLAVICILSTMLIVTASGTLSLYLGQENMLRDMYHYDMTVNTHSFLNDKNELVDPDDPTVEGYHSASAPKEEVIAFEPVLLELAQQNNVTLSADPSKLLFDPPQNQMYRCNAHVDNEEPIKLSTLLYYGYSYRFDVTGDEENCLAFVDSIRNAYGDHFTQIPNVMVSDIFTARQEGYGLYGGLLFLGVFFGLLFLAVTVLLIYFKQITEGREDRERFVILQQVGMDDTLVKKTINRQVLWVFFIPLGITILHMLFASRIISRMLMVFRLNDYMLVLTCIGGVLIVFALMYFVIYRLTAKVYYRIVKMS